MRDPGLRDIGTEIRVGIFVLFSAAAFVTALFWISGSPFRGPSIRVWGAVDDAGHIARDSPVLMRGVEIGAVESVSLTPDGAVLALSLSSRIPLPASTRGAIQPQGFLGQQLVELMPGPADAEGRMLASGDTIPLSRASDLMSVASSLGDGTGALMDRVQSMLDDRFAVNLARGSEAFATATGELAQLLEAEGAAIGRLLANIDTLAASLGEAAGSEEIDGALANLDTLSARLAGASEEFAAAGRSLAAITGRLEAGEGTLGRMLTDETLYNEMRETLTSARAASEELALLLQDLRERPDRYLSDLKISVF